MGKGCTMSFGPPRLILCVPFYPSTGYVEMAGCVMGVYSDVWYQCSKYQRRWWKWRRYLDVMQNEHLAIRDQNRCLEVAEGWACLWLCLSILYLSLGYVKLVGRDVGIRLDIRGRVSRRKGGDDRYAFPRAHGLP
jgi:hypothetical protein